MKKRIAGIFAGFLALMLLFTFLSRAADSVSVAKVTVQAPQKGKITHSVSGSGKVVQNREQAVSVLADQVVQTIYVEEGQQVSAGDVLFAVDMEVLREQILEKKQEMEIADLQSRDKQSSLEAQEKKDELAKSRAEEDYGLAAGKGNTAVGRAARELNNARAKLQALEQTPGGSAESGVQAVLQKACEQKQLEYELAVEYKEELEKEIDDLVERAIAQAKGETPARANLVPAARENHTAAWSAEQEMTEQNVAEQAMAMQTMASEQAMTEQKTTAEQALTAEQTMAQQTAAAEQAMTEQTAAAEQAMTEQTASAEQTIPEKTAEEQETADAPQTDVPQTDAPQTNAPQTDMPQTNAPQTESEPEIIFEAETDSRQTESLWLLEQRIRRENQPLLDDAEKQIRLKEQEKKEADAALQEYLQQQSAGAGESAQQMRAQLLEEIRAKEEAYNDAMTAANDSLRAAGRAVEDASAPKGTDSTAQIDEITREQRELQLEKLESLYRADGQVQTPIDAVVANIYLTTGDRTPNGTAVLLYDRTSGNKLMVQVPQSQEPYIARGDAVTVKTGQNKVLENLTVDSVRTDEEDQELLDVTVQLPMDALEAGVFASMEAVRSSETYDCCVPIQAVYEDQGKNFVYILVQSSTVLGTELTAQRLDVTVLEKNETMAALQKGSIGSDQQVIVSSDKMIAQGSRVRLMET